MTMATIKSIVEHFYYWEKQTPERVFLRQPYGNTWHTLTYAQAGEEARRMATALHALGLKAGEHVGILSKNCYHWLLADLAIMMAGYVSVPFYASLPKAQLAEVIALSDIKLLFVGKLDTWGDKATAVPAEVEVVRFPHYAGNAQVTNGIDWNELITQHPPKTENFCPTLDSLWTILFTSGTTGTPKGVMHAHRSPGQIIADEEESNFIGIFDLPEVRTMSFLPLNHVAERIGLELPTIARGGSMSFAESIDTFAQNLRETQPTLFFAVPRIWSKFYAGIIAKIPAKALIATLQVPILGGWIRMKLRTAMGLRDVGVVATGSAITPAFLKSFYRKLGLHLIEAYGMTEVCGSITNSPARDTPVDSVGEVIPHGAIKIDTKTGEVLMQSPYMMMGYYKNPEKTAEVLQNGWLHSGDTGHIDEQGYLRVVGRVKDAFKTSKGKYVVPNPLEELLLQNDYIEQACIVGLGIPQPIALLNLSELGYQIAKEEVADSIAASIATINAGVANFSRLSTAVVQTKEWSEENGLLTPTLKVRRQQVDKLFGSKYALWQRATTTIVWE